MGAHGRRIGAPLFERTSRQVSLTPLGRDLATDLAPLVQGMDEAVRRAADRARGTTGLLRAGFLGAAAGQLLLRALELFGKRHPDCRVTIHECQIHDAMRRLRGGELDVLITAFPVSQAVAGPVPLSEARVLAVPAGSSWAAHASVSIEVLAEQPVIQLPPDMPRELRHERTPTRTPAGRPVPPGPTAATFPEVLALVAAGEGVFASRDPLSLLAEGQVIKARSQQGRLAGLNGPAVPTQGEERQRSRGPAASPHSMGRLVT